MTTHKPFAQLLVWRFISICMICIGEATLWSGLPSVTSETCRSALSLLKNDKIQLCTFDANGTGILHVTHRNLHVFPRHHPWHWLCNSRKHIVAQNSFYGRKIECYYCSWCNFLFRASDLSRDGKIFGYHRLAFERRRGKDHNFEHFRLPALNTRSHCLLINTLRACSFAIERKTKILNISGFLHLRTTAFFNQQIFLYSRL